ncbi:class I SAM-dependent methyltransferase [Parafrankia discariae]|uniref:class I SAM-dependent methyltransferase n=1 Tax=Parafrankia discariae TaxID=365528 RepID=UPI0003AA7E76|nr:class I SAM-dependent methyltransferase [Parafrankia discariae]
MENRETSAHYERLAGSYDQAWTYSETFLDWMAGEIVGSLELTRGDRIADVGCGTGLHTRRLLGLVRPTVPILCVDPSPAMLRQLPADSGLRPVCASAEQFAAVDGHEPDAALPGSLDAIVVKEAVHHIAAADRPQVIAGLAGLLGPAGRLLVVMLPRKITYPLFGAALRRFEQLQPDPETIADHMWSAGLAVSVSYRERSVEIPKGRYLGMVRGRHMSLLSTFDDDALSAGVAEIDAAHPESLLSFPTGSRSSSARRGRHRVAGDRPATVGSTGDDSRWPSAGPVPGPRACWARSRPPVLAARFGVRQVTEAMVRTGRTFVRARGP